MNLSKSELEELVKELVTTLHDAIRTNFEMSPDYVLEEMRDLIKKVEKKMDITVLEDYER